MNKFVCTQLDEWHTPVEPGGVLFISKLFIFCLGKILTKLSELMKSAVIWLLESTALMMHIVNKETIIVSTVFYAC